MMMSKNFQKEIELMKNDYFPKTKRNATIIKDTYKGKIPYVTSDYLDYYEDSVREILKSWGISND